MWGAQLVISSADRSSASIQVIHNTSWLHRERNRSRCCSYRTACRVEPTRPRDARVQASTHRHCLRSLLRRRIRRQLRPHGNAPQSLRVDRRESGRSGLRNCDLAFRGPTGACALDSVAPRGCVSKKIICPTCQGRQREYSSNQLHAGTPSLQFCESWDHRPHSPDPCGNQRELPSVSGRRCLSEVCDANGL
jgi:hypothetical protein